MELMDALKWRYATKRMNGEKLPEEKLEIIMDAINLAPTSLGLQPFSVVVISDEKMKKEISEKACQQPQVLECSHLLVFAAWNEVSEAKIDDYLENVARTRGVGIETLAPYKEMINGFVGSGGAVVDVKAWTARQAYIAFGIGLAAAATERVDATPIEGYDNAAMDELLGLNEKGLHSAVVIALGYRDDEQDYLAKAAKVRREKSELFLLN